MSEKYQVVSSGGSDRRQSVLPESNELAATLAKDGQLIMPLLDLVEQAQVAIDDLVDVTRCNAVAITRCETSSDTCRKNNTNKPG
jgi:hypothetical protein